MTAQVYDLSRKIGSVPLTVGDYTDWTVEGDPNPQPVKLSRQGASDILVGLHNLVLPPTTGRGLSYDAFYLGLYNPQTPSVHSKTTTHRELITSIIDEVLSHTELRAIPFTTIQILHDTIDEPHTDDSL